MIVELPWPPPCLSPNSRKDRRGTTRTRKNYKGTWWAIAKAAKFQPTDHLVITFHPPDKRARDMDNMLGAIKYGLDGLALAAGQDDSEWSLTIRKGAPRSPVGMVVVQAASSAVDIPLLGTIS